MRFERWRRVVLPATMTAAVALAIGAGAVAAAPTPHVPRSGVRAAAGPQSGAGSAREPLVSLASDAIQALWVEQVPKSERSRVPDRDLLPGQRTVNCAKLKCVALTFDDGPGPYTAALLATLRKSKVPATFFMLGSQAARYPGITAQVAAGGHEIGNHSWNHPMLTKLTVKAMRSQLARTDRAVLDAADLRPDVVRPPYGAHDKRVDKVAARPIVLWNVDPLDWRDRNSKKVAARVVKDTRPGSIVLMHDIHPTSVKAVPSIIAKLRKKGYTFVTVSQLFDNGDGMKPGRTYRGRGE